MKIYTIEQKMSNSGSIHDIASDLYDRDIMFREGTKFAVVLSSYYSGKGYTTHSTARFAAKKQDSLGNYSSQIIDIDGNHYDNIGGGNLEMTDY